MQAVQGVGHLHPGRARRGAGAFGRPDRQGSGHVRVAVRQAVRAGCQELVPSAQRAAGHAGQLAQGSVHVALPRAHLQLGGYRQADARGGREVCAGGCRVARHHERHERGARRHRHRQRQGTAQPTRRLQRASG